LGPLRPDRLTLTIRRDVFTKKKKQYRPKKSPLLLQSASLGQRGFELPNEEGQGEKEGKGMFADAKRKVGDAWGVAREGPDFCSGL